MHYMRLLSKHTFLRLLYYVPFLLCPWWVAWTYQYMDTHQLQFYPSWRRCSFDGGDDHTWAHD